MNTFLWEEAFHRVSCWFSYWWCDLKNEKHQSLHGLFFENENSCFVFSVGRVIIHLELNSRISGLFSSQFSLSVEIISISFLKSSHLGFLIHAISSEYLWLRYPRLKAVPFVISCPASGRALSRRIALIVLYLLLNCGNSRTNQAVFAISGFRMHAQRVFEHLDDCPDR